MTVGIRKSSAIIELLLGTLARMILAGSVALTAVLMSPQRGERPKRSETAVKIARSAPVTTGRIRMTDPDSLLRIQQRGGPASVLLRSNEKRSDLVRALSQREARKFKAEEIPAFLATLIRKPEEGSLYGQLFGSSGSYSFDAKFGEIAEGTLAPKGHYDGVASKTGLVSVDQVKGGPFLATKIVTYTGYWVNGEPQVDQQKMAAGSSFSVPVKAGQEYTVFYMFDSQKLKQGAYKGTSTVYDGAQTTLNITGSIVPVKGGLKVGVDSYNPIVGTGQVRTIPLTLLYSGNTQSASVSAKASFVGGAIQSAKVFVPEKIDLKAGQVQTVNVKVSAENVADGQYPVEVRLSAPGAPETVLKLDVSFRTLWVGSLMGDLNQEIGDGTAFPKLRMNSLGYWEASGLASSKAIFVGDRVMVAVFSSQLVKGNKHGVKYDMVLGGASNPTHVNLARSGYSKTVQDLFPQFASGGFQAVLSVNDIPGFNQALSDAKFTDLLNDK